MRPWCLLLVLTASKATRYAFEEPSFSRVAPGLGGLEGQMQAQAGYGLLGRGRGESGWEPASANRLEALPLQATSSYVQPQVLPSPQDWADPFKGMLQAQSTFPSQPDVGFDLSGAPGAALSALDATSALRNPLVKGVLSGSVVGGSSGDGAVRGAFPQRSGDLYSGQYWQYGAPGGGGFAPAASAYGMSALQEDLLTAMPAPAMPVAGQDPAGAYVQPFATAQPLANSYGFAPGPFAYDAFTQTGLQAPMTHADDPAGTHVLPVAATQPLASDGFAHDTRVFAAIPQSGVHEPVGPAQTLHQLAGLSNTFPRLRGDARLLPDSNASRSWKMRLINALNGTNASTTSDLDANIETVVILIATTLTMTVCLPVLVVVIFGAFIAPAGERTMAPENDADVPSDVAKVTLDDLASMVPEGNIFRHCGRSSEKLKHQADINNQILHILEDDYIQQLVDEYPWPYGHQDVDHTIQERQYKLTYLLRQALRGHIEAAKAKGDEPGGSSSISSGQITGMEFLANLLEHGPPKRHFRGMLLLPAEPHNIRHWAKDRGMAWLLGTAMLMSPIFMMIAQYDTFHLHFIAEPISQRLSWAEITCLGSRDQACSLILGAVFLVFILEYERFVVRKEKLAFKKISLLPGDKFWSRFGQASNALCLLFTALVIPLVFWSEEDSKDIVFDSMGMLFIFGMDDLSSEAMSYLEQSDDDFQAKYADFMEMLLHCPMDLQDLIDFNAKSAEGIWVLEFTKDEGVLGTTKDTEEGELEPCQMRLHPILEDNEVQFEYSIGTANRQILGSKRMHAMEYLWNMVQGVLIFAEMTFPITYLVFSDPCYA